MRMASRMARAKESGTARIARITSEREAQGERILRLNIGEPDFDTPEFIAEAARRAIAKGKTRYTDVAGTRELREAAAEKFRSENSIDCTADQVVIGAGAKQLIFNALMATLENGDEAIVPVPSWVSYPDIASIAGARPVIVPCGSGTGFKLAAEQLDEAVSGRTRWLILNSPCNPTGAVYSANELRELADRLRPHPQVCVLCDDIYEKIVFDGAEFSTMAEIAPDLSDRTSDSQRRLEITCHDRMAHRLCCRAAAADLCDDQAAEPIDDQCLVNRTGSGTGGAGPNQTFRKVCIGLPCGLPKAPGSYPGTTVRDFRTGLQPAGGRILRVCVLQQPVRLDRSRRRSPEK